MNIFDILNAISHTKNKKLVDEADFEKVYNPFMINRMLSMHPDTVEYTQYMDANINISKKGQFYFYLNIIPKEKRFFKYLKKNINMNDEIKILQEYFQCNSEQAKEQMGRLSKDQIGEIKMLFNSSEKIKREK